MEWWAVASIVSALFAAGANMYSTKRTNSTQIDLMKQQNQFNAEQVDKQNEYNSPSNQAQLLKEAGFNPAFLFGNNGIDATQSAPAQGANVPTLTSPQMDGSSISNAFLNAKTTEAQVRKSDAEIEELIAKKDTYRKALDQADERFQVEMDKVRSDSSLNDAARQQRLQLIEQSKAECEKLYMDVEKASYEIDLIFERAETERWSQRKLSREIDRLVKITPHEINKLIADANLSNENAVVAKKSVELIGEQISTQIKQRGYIDAQTVGQIIENAVKDAAADEHIAASILASESPVLSLLYRETDGLIGSFLGALGAYTQGFTTGRTKAGVEKQTQHSKYRHERLRNTNSYLFDY